MNEADVFHVHDDILLDMDIDYFEKSVTLSCRKTYPEEREYSIIFNDFIYMNCTAMDFFGRDNRMYDISFGSQPDKTKSFISSCETVEEEPLRGFEENGYINVWLGMMSGDAVNIVCRKLTFE